MAGPKILVVTRRFWPFCDDACQRLLHFSASLQRAGGDLTILTARWHASWPEFSLCRAVPVHRLLPGPISSWNESHFQKNVVQWIAKRSAEFDCVYVDRADGLLSAILTKSSKWDMPVITRFSPADSGYGLDVGQRINQLAMAESCRRCAKVVCTSLSAHRLLVSQGIQDSRIIRISDPAWERIEWTAESKAMASHALFETCSDFVIPGRSSIILHLGLSEPKTLRAAIQTLCDLLDSGSMIRVWVVGSGLPPNSLYDLIKSRGWHREILLFDSFDD
ncbi:MAG: glycosyltransferase, partial [Pirellula sp.]